MLCAVTSRINAPGLFQLPHTNVKTTAMLLSNEDLRPSKESFADEEATGLLRESTDESRPTSRQQNCCRRRFQYLPYILHAILIAIYTSIFVYKLHTISPSYTVLSPANNAIEYTRKTFFPVTYDNPYTGDPRPEFDEAWHDLMEYAHIRVSKEELDAANHTSLPLKDGSGYIAQLASTHQLHCLKQIRHYLHQDHYFPNATALELKAQGMHVDHCLEVLRLATMCAGDTSITPFYLAETDDGLVYPFVKTRTYHHCVNWDKLREFSRERAVDLFDPELLALPEGATLLEVPVPSMVL